MRVGQKARRCSCAWTLSSCLHSAGDTQIAACVLVQQRTTPAAAVRTVHVREQSRASRASQPVPCPSLHKRFSTPGPAPDPAARGAAPRTAQQAAPQTVRRAAPHRRAHPLSKRHAVHCLAALRTGHAFSALCLIYKKSSRRALPSGGFASHACAHCAGQPRPRSPSRARSALGLLPPPRWP
jgi:hypothetical protein